MRAPLRVLRASFPSPRPHDEPSRLSVSTVTALGPKEAECELNSPARSPNLAAERHSRNLPCRSLGSSSPGCDFLRTDFLGMLGSGLLRNSSGSRAAQILVSTRTKVAVMKKSYELQRIASKSCRLERQRDSQLHPSCKDRRNYNRYSLQGEHTTLFFTSLLVLLPRPLAGRCRYPHW